MIDPLKAAVLAFVNYGIDEKRQLRGDDLAHGCAYSTPALRAAIAAYHAAQPSDYVELKEDLRVRDSVAAVPYPTAYGKAKAAIEALENRQPFYDKALEDLQECQQRNEDLITRAEAAEARVVGLRVVLAVRDAERDALEGHCQSLLDHFDWSHRGPGQCASDWWVDIRAALEKDG